MALRLLPATLADIPQFTNVYLQSFQDAIALTCFPRSSPAIAAWWTAMNETDFQTQPSARFLKVVAIDDAGADKIIAYAKWNVPVQVGDVVQGGGDDPDSMPEWPEDAHKELCDEFFGALARRRQKIMGERQHYYLEIIGTLPEYQGQGAASLLLRWGLEQADAQGLEAYVEASPLVVPVYERFGWVTVETFTPERLPEHTESLMLRPAKK